MKKFLLLSSLLIFISSFSGFASATPINHAETGTATQSSTGYWGWSADASRAIDGNTDGDYGHGSVSHTNYDKEAWWKVDLGSMLDLDEIVLWNRTDCCGNRLANFNVTIWDDTNSVVWGSYNLATFGTSKSFILPDDIVGQFVQVQLTGADYLQLAEVQVFGEVPEPATMLLFGLGLLGLAGVNRRKQ